MQERQVTVEGETFPLPSPSTCSRPPTRSSTKAPTRCPRPSSTGSCCGSASATRVATRSTTSSRAGWPGGRRRSTSTRSPTRAGLLAMQAAVETVTVDESVGRYCVDLAVATRDHPDVLTGASPRGSLGLVLTARALAVLRGRDYVIPEDVKAVARSVLVAPDHGPARALDDRGQRPPGRRRRARPGPDARRRSSARRPTRSTARWRAHPGARPGAAGRCPAGRRRSRAARRARAGGARRRRWSCWRRLGLLHRPTRTPVVRAPARPPARCTRARAPARGWRRPTADDVEHVTRVSAQAPYVALHPADRPGQRAAARRRRPCSRSARGAGAGGSSARSGSR